MEQKNMLFVMLLIFTTRLGLRNLFLSTMRVVIKNTILELRNTRIFWLYFNKSFFLVSNNNLFDILMNYSGLILSLSIFNLVLNFQYLSFHKLLFGNFVSRIKWTFFRF